MKKILVLAMLVMAALCSVCFADDLGTSPNEQVFVGAKEKLHVDYYYKENCPYCEAVAPWLAHIARKYGETLEIEKHDVIKDESAYNDFVLKMSLFEVPADNQGVPAIVFNKKVFIGNDEIWDGFEKEIVSATK